MIGVAGSHSSEPTAPNVRFLIEEGVAARGANYSCQGRCGRRNVFD